MPFKTRHLNFCFKKHRISDTCLTLFYCGDRMGDGTSRQDILLNVVPFSDEWVAALEALGEVSLLYINIFELLS